MQFFVTVNIVNINYAVKYGVQSGQNSTFEFDVVVLQFLSRSAIEH